jgi:putative ABC transport system permease protein
VKQRARVIVIGSKIKEDLFGLSDAIGSTIRIKDQSYRVIGIFPKKGSASIIQLDNVIVAPYTTVQQFISGTSHFNAIYVRAASKESTDRTVYDIKPPYVNRTALLMRLMMIFM